MRRRRAREPQPRRPAQPGGRGRAGPWRGHEQHEHDRAHRQHQACASVMPARPGRARELLDRGDRAQAHVLVDRAVAELGPLEERGQPVHAGHPLVALQRHAAQVLHRRLVRPARQALAGHVPLHRGVGGDHRPAGVALAPQPVEVRLGGRFVLVGERERRQVSGAPA